jgi:tetratricopeptide (TPR) repeat protein
MSASAPAPPPPAPSGGAAVAGRRPAPVGPAVLLAALGAALAFLLASVPASDSLLWARLAAGRDLASGRAPAGSLPYLDAPANPHHRLDALYDTSLYAGYTAFGGTGLVVLNAGLAAALALLLTRAGRRTGAGTAAVALGSMAAVLAMSPGFGLTPTLASYALFVACLLLLSRAARATDHDGFWKTAWPVLFLTAAWANTDRWVVLAPAAAALLALGEWWRGRGAATRRLALLVLPMLAASVLSPNHVRVWNGFVPAGGPGRLREWYDELPLAAGIAYALLGAFGGIGVTAGRRGGAGGAALLWLVLLGLTLWLPAAFAPFFAATAGPCAAAGLSALWNARPGVAPRPRLARAAQVCAALAGILLVAAAWPGWLQAPPYARRVWVVEENPSLRDAVEQLQKWRAAGELGHEARGLALSPEAAHYSSWFGDPGTGRDNIPPADFARVVDGLLREADGLDGGDWREVLRARRINHLVLPTATAEPSLHIFAGLTTTPSEWRLLFLRGGTAVFGWRDPHAVRGGFDGLAVDLAGRAFGTGADRAPDEWPGRAAAPRHWWSAFAEPPPPPAPERAEAALYLTAFDARRPEYLARGRAVWLNSQAAGIVAGAAGAVRPPAALETDLRLRFASVRGGREAFAARNDEGPYGDLLLAVRAARRALHANPDDAGAYFLLGEAYLRLSQNTRERFFQRQLPAFERTRHTQAVVAFNQALVRRPDFLEAHGRLARLYKDLGSLDLAVRHLNGLLDASRARGPRPGESLEAYRESLAPLEEEKALLEALVRRQEEEARQDAAGRPALAAAREEAGRGLPARALETLLKSDLAEFGAEGAEMELELLLWAGRVQEARDWSAGGEGEGSVTYHELLVRLAAATGDYAMAESELRRVSATLVPRTARGLPPQAQAGYDLARALHQALQPQQSAAALAQTALAEQMFLDEAGRIITGLRRRANVDVVRGLLALEAGRTADAEAAFRAALDTWQGPGGGGLATGLDFSGRPVAEDCLRLLSTRAKE